MTQNRVLIQILKPRLPAEQVSEVLVNSLTAALFSAARAE
jgi:hypothetical protein